MIVPNQVIRAGFYIKGSIWTLGGGVSKLVGTASAKPKVGRCINRKSE